MSHYTDVEGLIGIITSGQFWASNVSFLNDSKELVHGLEGARAAIKLMSGKAVYENWSGELEDVIGQFESGQIPDTYAVCFCERPDLLSQWRGYGKSTQGVSLTFSRPRLAALLKNQKARLHKVIYGKVTTKIKVQRALQAELAELADTEDLIGKRSTEARRRELARRVSELLPQFKHLGFSSEREWRFIVQKATKTNELCFRSNNGVIIPYIKIGPGEADKLPLKSVQVGPGRDHDLIMRSIRVFLDAHGYSEVGLSASDIPFRL